MLLTAAAACQAGEPDMRPSFAVVRGAVTTSSGAGVPGVHVLLEVRRASDNSRIGQEPAVTDGSGAYLVTLAVFLPPFDALVSVTATPADTTVLRPATVTGKMVRFSEGAPSDTVRVDVVLSPP